MNQAPTQVLRSDDPMLSPLISQFRSSLHTAALSAAFPYWKEKFPSTTHLLKSGSLGYHDTLIYSA